MVNVFIYGLDQFVVGEISAVATEDLAKLLEVEEDDVNFIAPSSMIFHKGVEQTSWLAVVDVHLPEESRYEQANVQKLLRHYIDEMAINVEFHFHYFNRKDYAEDLNEDYPRYLTESNVVNTEDDEEDIEREEGDGDDEIFTGDIFEGVLK